MTVQTIVLIILIIGLIVLEIIFSATKKNISNKLTSLLMEYRFDELDALLNKKTTKYFVKAYNYYYLKFNKAVIQRNNGEVNECIEILEKTKSSKEQKAALYSKEFYYYLSIDDKEKARIAYENYKENSTDELLDIDIMYDTFVLGNSTYLERTLKAYKNASKEKLPDLDLLLSEMYKNKNKKTEADKYSRLAQEHVKELKKSIVK